MDLLNKTWQATLQSAKGPETPPPVLQRVQNVVQSIERTRQEAESSRDHVLTLQTQLSEQEASVRTALSSFDQAESRALKSIFVRDSRPIWSLGTSLGTEWEEHSGESFSSQLETSTAFTKRLPFTFLIHALLIVLMATALHWMRRRIRKLAEEKPDLPVLARFIFLGQVLGASVFLVWVLRSWHLPAEAAETHGRIWRTIRAIAKIGLILLPAAFLANIFGYINFGNLLGIIFLRSVYIAAMLYTAIRIIEGLITIALQVRPLGSLRVISLHRPMLQRRACRVLEFLAFLFWLNVLLSFFGLRDSLIASIGAALNANLAIGSFNITLGASWHS